MSDAANENHLYGATKKMSEEIKVVTKYCYRGCEFSTLEQARRFKEKRDRLDAIEKLLPARPKDDGCRFSNGEGYLQHDSARLADAKAQLLSMLIKEYGDGAKMKEAVDANAWQWIGRCYADGSDLFHSILARFCCIDSEGREFGQMYYAIHPEAAQEKRLNAEAKP